MDATPSFPDPARTREGVALGLLPGVGAVAVRRAVEQYGSAADAFRATAAPRSAALAALDEAARLIDSAAAAGARVTVFGEGDYPDRLTDLSDPPPFLFVLGDYAAMTGPVVSIVGTRHPSPGGVRFTRSVAAALARCGATIVSGMARGIDGAAHVGALEVHGRTVAVLGSGVDVAYPPSHRWLHERISAEGGAVVSELGPGLPAPAGAFPRRNRIIAALCHTLIVVEAGNHSGALITSDRALELGRNIGAVPGPVDSPRCVGTNRLLRDGAVVITSPDEAVLLAGLTPAAHPWDDRAPGKSLGRRRSPSRLRRLQNAALEAGPPGPRSQLSPAAEAVLSAVHGGAADVDDLARAVRLPARELAAAMAALEVHGVIRTDHRGGISMVT